MTNAALRQQISREVKRALQEAGLSAAKAAAKMPRYEYRGIEVQPEAKLIYRWTKGEVTAPLERLQEFADAIGQTLVLRIGPDAKEAAPDLPERLNEILVYLRAIAGAVPVSAEDRAAIEALHHGVAALRRTERPPDAPRRKANRRPPGK